MKDVGGDRRRPRPRGYDAGFALSYQRIEKIARAIRARIASDIRDDEALPGVQLFEKLDELDVVIAGGRRVKLDWAVEELPGGVEGRTRYYEGEDKIVIELSPSTYRGLLRGQRRARSTLFHEIAHAFLHTSLLIEMSQIPHIEKMALQRAFGPAHDHCRDSEWQADAVSATLLMPARGLAVLEKEAHRLGGYQVQSRFRVSAESARIRILTYEKRKSQLL